MIFTTNNLGGASALLLLILLSQSKFLHFLLDTALGRSILILFILVISYINKILGVVSVLFIIIMFNNSDIGYMEGFTNSVPQTTTPTENTTTVLSDEQKQKLLAQLQEKAKETPPPSSTSTSTSSGAEGFNTFETERNIQKGKSSNSIPVNQSATQSEDVDAFGTFGGKFSDSFASF
jgi:hypothetical protein